MARGSITKRGGSWRIAVELPADPETGKRRQRFETLHGLKKDADKRLTELLALVDHEQLGVSPKVTTQEYLDRWLRDYCDSLSPKTRSSYALLTRLYVSPHIGVVRLDKLSPTHIVGLLRRLRESPRADGREGTLSPATISSVYRMLHSALERAVKWRLLATNPADGVDAPRVPRKEMRSFTVEQAQAFLAAAAAEEGAKWLAFFTVSLNTGCRPGELKALRWSDIDLVSSTLCIQRHAQKIRGVGTIVGPTKTAGSRRPLSFGSDVAVVLRRHRAEQALERLRMGALWQDGDLVFPSESGTVLEDHRIRIVFRRTCERAGVPVVRLYDLRHSSASLLLSAGIHPRVVAERLGHANVSLTLNTYSHVLPGLQQDAANTLETLLRQAR